MLGLWDGNPVKSDCYDRYTTTNVINLKKVKKKKDISSGSSLDHQRTEQDGEPSIGLDVYNDVRTRKKR